MVENFKSVHDREVETVVSLCEMIGYGNTISIAARGWAKKPSMGGQKSMASWLRSLADGLEEEDELLGREG